MTELPGRLKLETFDYNQAGWNTLHTANMQKLNDFVEKLCAQDPVKDKDLATPPGSPVAGDRYIVAATATGAWVGKEKNIAEWNGVEWRFTAPVTGMHCYVLDEGLYYLYAAAVWGVHNLITDDQTMYQTVAGRATLTSGVPVTTADVTAATQIYFTPFKGNRVPIWNSSAWQSKSFTEKSIKLTDTQTGSTTVDSAVVTGLTDTAQLVRGMEVTGTGIPASTTISSINSATQITLSANATATGTPSLTFKCPAGKNYDVFAVANGSTIALRFSNAWTSDTVRADAISAPNGFYVNTNAINAADSNAIAAERGLYLFSVKTTAAGQTESSFGGAHQAGGKQFVWNNYNRVRRRLGVIDTTASWAYTIASYHQANGAAGNKVEFLLGLAEDTVSAEVRGEAVHSAGPINCGVGIGLDSTTVSSAQVGGGGTLNTVSFVQTASYRGIPVAGYHYLAWLEISDATGTTTWAGNANAFRQNGLLAEIFA